jgi:hypothetical protein
VPYKRLECPPWGVLPIVYFTEQGEADTVFKRSRNLMSTMISEVYDALKEAGASEEKARKAAEALASYENRFTRIESDLAVLKWMVGFNMAMTVAVLWKAFSS